VTHEVRDVNVTINMNASTLAWVRVEAARAGRSVSAWIAARLDADRLAADAMAGAGARIDRFLEDFPGLPLSEGGRIYLDREALHDDRFRGFDYPALHPGQGQPGEAGEMRAVAEGPSEFGPADA
jgi:hypothetical protein